jgi:hypothetical protein
LPPPPKHWGAMLKHPESKGFINAAEIEYTNLFMAGTFEFIDETSVPQGTLPIPLMWVFSYKFDSDGYFLKYKARIVVRGDLQVTFAETAATTLAARTFRTLIAIITAFGLVMRQYDVVNAFVNAQLHDVVYTYHPDGFVRPGLIRLRQALYGLKQSPFLWQALLAETLESFGLTPVPGVDCLYVRQGLIIFYFVDDIIAACHPDSINLLEDFEAKLAARFKLKRIGEPRYFLGIRILRNEKTGTISLLQDSYIEKIVERFNLTQARAAWVPMSQTFLAKNTAQALPGEVFTYQQKVGSVNFTATISRPDIAKAVSMLSEHLQNPSIECQDAIDHVLRYLYTTRYFAIQFTTLCLAAIFCCFSDASFADDKETRQSSQGFLFSLYNGPVDWQATKQRTVTTSSTEAELLALSAASREMMWWQRFFKAIRFDTKEKVLIHTDNAQTLRLVASETPKLVTKLRHIDIHQCWLRQQVQNGTINVNWVPTASMPADGMTKILPAQAHRNFLAMLRMQDVEKEITSKAS